MATGAIPSPSDIISVTVGTLQNKTTDTNGYVTGFGNTANGKRFIVSPKCNNKNVALVPWVTMDGNWYCTAVAPSGWTVQKSTNVGDVSYLIVIVR